ncbi:MAG TPA: hypothetical protein VGC76_06965 [Pyrinomonadaceae bacterium]|jgi:hypothetical protein
MNKIILFLVLGILSAVSCTVSRNSAPQANNQSSATPQATNTPAKTEEKAADSTGKKEERAITKADCTKVDTGDKALLEKQTFPIDFAPFEKSCFVTSYNPEYDNPPLEAEFAIYTNGKKVFDFPGQFNGVTFGCWVEGVAFEDLNGDDLKDITIVGKCSAKAEPYNENMVYVNTGKAFTTNEDANYKISDYTKIKEINDYVRQNKQIFFK